MYLFGVLGAVASILHNHPIVSSVLQLGVGSTRRRCCVLNPPDELTTQMVGSDVTPHRPQAGSLAPGAPPVDAIDDLGRAQRRKRTRWWLGGLGTAVVVTIAAGVSLGPVPISPVTVWQVIGHHTLGWPATVSWPAAEDSIVWVVRSPRVLLGAIVGAGLAVSGVALQALVRNVLADPFILGVSSGASTGAAAAILFGFGVGLGSSSLTGTAFLGALAATAAVLLIARVGGRLTSTRLLLAGVTVGYALSATTSFLIFASHSREGVKAVLFWLLGSLDLARWSSVPVAALAVAGSFALLLVWGRRLDALAIGDETARTLGTPPTRFRIQVFVLVSICVGAVVAVSGTIGFVGLVVPHLARRLVGGEHRRVLAVSALIGAIFLGWADVVARVALQPAEVPLGIITAIVGTPFLIVLVRRFHAAVT